MATETLQPLDNVTPANIESVRNQAIAFYEKDSNLTPEDRKQLYIFFEQQCRRMLLGFSVGVALGTAAPFIIRKKGSLVHPAFPIIGAALGGSIVPGLVNNSIYELQVTEFNRKFGEQSAIVQCINNTPDPITKSVFWSNYFKKSMNDPNFRMKDPRTIDPKSVKFFSIEPQPKITPYGRPGHYKANETNQPETLNAQYQSLGGWDKIRYQESQKYEQQKQQNREQNDRKYEGNLQQTKLGDVKDFDFPLSGSPSQTIGDSYNYDKNDLNVAPVFDSSSSTLFGTEKDHLIQSQGSNGSSWERIRRS